MYIKNLRNFLSVFLFSSLFFANHSAQLIAGDCLVESWPVVYDTNQMTPSIFPWGYHEGECEYGVDFKEESSAFLQMNFSDLTPPSPSGPYQFQVNLKTRHLVQGEAGLIRIFELLPPQLSATTEEYQTKRATIALDLGWNPPKRGGVTKFYLRGSYAAPHPIFKNDWEQHYLDPSAVEVGQGDISVFVQIFWWPSSSDHEDDAVIELWANGTLIASKSGLRLPAVGAQAPNAIRFGVIPSVERVGRGTFRFTPLQPTPNRPWID